MKTKTKPTKVMKVKQVLVISRDGNDAGVMTGTIRSCGMAGCNCNRYGVRWARDNKITWPSGKGLRWASDTLAKMI